MKRLELVGKSDVRAREPVPIGDGLVARARAVAEAMFATDEGPPPPKRLDWLEKELRGFLGHAGSSARFVFGASVYAVTLLGPLVSGRLGGFASLDLEARKHVLERVEKSFLSTPLLGVKAILCILYFEHPDAARFIGANGACLT
ncbi:MAG: hypothetical protein JNL38_16820 [Myxococcales bacterium]|nr:hypothetical protein [Myxococcales bacterium]